MGVSSSGELRRMVAAAMHGGFASCPANSHVCSSAVRSIDAPMNNVDNCAILNFDKASEPVLQIKAGLHFTKDAHCPNPQMHDDPRRNEAAAFDFQQVSTRSNDPHLDPFCGSRV